MTDCKKEDQYKIESIVYEVETRFCIFLSRSESYKLIIEMDYDETISID